MACYFCLISPPTSSLFPPSTLRQAKFVFRSCGAGNRPQRPRAPTANHGMCTKHPRRCLLQLVVVRGRRTGTLWPIPRVAAAKIAIWTGQGQILEILDFGVQWQFHRAMDTRWTHDGHKIVPKTVTIVRSTPDRDHIVIPTYRRSCELLQWCTSVGLDA